MVWHTIFHHVFMFTSIKNAGNRGGWMFFVPLFRSFCVGPALSLETIHNHTFSFFYLWPPTKNLSLPRNETGTCNYRLRERKNKKKTNQKMSKSYSTIFIHFIYKSINLKYNTLGCFLSIYEQKLQHNIFSLYTHTNNFHSIYK